MKIIVAIDENNAIGKDNQLLWHLPEDLKRFKKLTLNHSILMGRKTFESIGRPLPHRVNIVISRDKDFIVPEGVKKVSSIEEAIQITKNFSTDDAYIIGGGNIYRQTLDLVDTLEITLVHTQIPEADVYFPEINFNEWEKVQEEKHYKDEKHLYDYTFLTYVRK